MNFRPLIASIEIRNLKTAPSGIDVKNGDQRRKDHSSTPLAAKVLARLNRFYKLPERPRYFDAEAYQRWLERNGDILYDQFYSKYVDFAGKNILDIGCGYGGKTATYRKRNPALICGVDIDPSLVLGAKEYSGNSAGLTKFAAGDAASLPFRDSTFDLVISDDGFDHFKRPGKVVDEIFRVLKTDGLALISFVPYFSSDCSHLGEYLRVPWHHVFFSKNSIKQALYIVERYNSEQSTVETTEHRSGIDGVYNTFDNHLSYLSFRGLKRTLNNRQGVQLIRCRKQSKDWARLFTYVPFLNELFIDAVYCVIRKNDTSMISRPAFLRQAMLDFKQDFRAAISRFKRR